MGYNACYSEALCIKKHSKSSLIDDTIWEMPCFIPNVQKPVLNLSNLGHVQLSITVIISLGQSIIILGKRKSLYLLCSTLGTLKDIFSIPVEVNGPHRKFYFRPWYFKLVKLPRTKVSELRRIATLEVWEELGWRGSPEPWPDTAPTDDHGWCTDLQSASQDTL